MDENGDEPRQRRSFLPGVFSIPLVYIRGQTQPIWVVGMIIALPVIAIVLIAIARLAFRF